MSDTETNAEKGKEILEKAFGLYGGIIGGEVCGLAGGGEAGKSICGIAGKGISQKVADIIVDKVNEKITEIGNLTGRIITNEINTVFLQIGVAFCLFIKQMCCCY